MAYLELEDLRGYLDIDITSDNPLLQEAIEDAQSHIEGETNRKFEAETDTKYYEKEALNPWDSRQLDLLDEDLLTVTELLNGDEDSTEIVTANYWLIDRNLGPPYHGILLKTDITDYWQWDIDYWVAVTGTWGYSTTVPNDIRRATAQLAAYLYRAKDSQQFEVTAIVESGALAIPQGIPATVEKIIKKYKRRI